MPEPILLLFFYEKVTYARIFSSLFFNYYFLAPLKGQISFEKMASLQNDWE